MLLSRKLRDSLRRGLALVLLVVLALLGGRRRGYPLWAVEHNGCVSTVLGLLLGLSLSLLHLMLNLLLHLLHLQLHLLLHLQLLVVRLLLLLHCVWEV